MSGKKRHPGHRPSGRIPPLGVALAIAVSAVIVFFVGPAAGAMKLFTLQFLDLGVIGIAVFGALAGWLAGLALRLGRIRSERFGLWFAWVVALAMLGQTWLWHSIFLQVFQLPPGLPEGVWYPWEDWERTAAVISAYADGDVRGQQTIGLIWGLLYPFGWEAVVEFSNISGLLLYCVWMIEAAWLVSVVVMTCCSTVSPGKR